MTVYLDSSSLVKLYVDEADSARVATLAADAHIVASSTVAYAECRAALARRRREGMLGARTLSAIVARFDADWERLASIHVTNALAKRAGDLANRLGLRGFDAIHLASFELLLERAGEEDDVVFSTADDRLARAARRLG